MCSYIAHWISTARARQAKSDGELFLLEDVVDGGVDIVADDDRFAQLVVLADIAVSVMDHLGALGVLLGRRPARRVDPRTDEDALDGVHRLRIELRGSGHVARVRQFRVHVLLYASFAAVWLH